MGEDLTSQKNMSQFSPPKPFEEYPKDSVRKIAVLFTDVVGSTKFFSAKGDLAGREMLQRHQDIASRPIVEHGGIVVKTLGDSVMAYFSDPKEPIKAAIKIQQAFRKYNVKMAPESQINVRIGIHFGEGIVEKNDIYGNVVNLAAKIVPLASGDHILISKALYELVKALSPVRFKAMEAPKNKGVDDLSLYSVIWDESINFDPTANVLLFLKPLWNLGNPDFPNIWDRMLKDKDTFWEGSILRKKTFKSKAIALIVDEPTGAIEMANNVLADVRRKLNIEEGYHLLPLQILVDSGAYLKDSDFEINGFQIKWDDIVPGIVHISSSALRLIRNKENFKTDPPFDSENVLPVYKLLSEDLNGVSEAPLFLYQQALIRGEKSPCFYCGDRRHFAKDCPSKKIKDMTHILNKLAYSPVETMNTLFYNYLMHSGADAKASTKIKRRISEPYRKAYYSFHELKSILQLRFFRNIWDSYEDDWEELKARDTNGGDKGGQIWLAQDLIRTSRLGKAESQLNTLMLENSQDYKVYCAAGFLNIEHDSFSKAESYFSQALVYTKTTLQKVFVNFLLARLYELTDYPARAEAKIDEILSLDSQCSDAKYQKMIFKFQKGQEKSALSDLTHLVQKHGYYFVKALIDPALAPYCVLVQSRLKKIFNEAKEKANSSIQKAKEEIDKLTQMLGEDRIDDEDVQESWKRIDELLKTDSFLGYLDVEKLANTIFYKCREHITVQKKIISHIVDRLDQQFKEYLEFLKPYPYKSLIRPIYRQLNSYQLELNSIRDIVETESAEKFQEAFKRANALSNNAEDIPFKLKILDNVRITAIYLSTFVKRFLILQSLNFIICALLVPVVQHYSHFISPNIGIFDQNLWRYQKLFLIGGAVFSMVLAIITSLKSLSSKKNLVKPIRSIR